jgi:TolA-binding protein
MRPILLPTILAVSLALPILACSSGGMRPEDDARQNDTQRTLESVSSRLEAMEAKMSTMNDKFDSTRLQVDHLMSAQRAKPTAVVPHPSHSYGTNVTPTPVSADPEAGFLNDEAVQAYRQAMMLFRAGKFSDAVLGFSTFLEKFPDHPLAGSSQYYVGMSYLKQKEYALALQEFQRVLTSYDRSIHVAQTLREMADVEDVLKKPEEAMKHRQMLSSLFPQSPAAILEKATTPLGEATRESAAPAGDAALTGSPVNASPAAGDDLTPASSPAVDAPPTAPIGGVDP